MSEQKAMRWDPYVLATDDRFDLFWHEHLAEKPRDVLMVVGHGFDVRATLASQRICAAGGVGRRDAWLLDFQSGLPSTAIQQSLTEKNFGSYGQIFINGHLSERSIQLSTGGNLTGTSRSTRRAINDIATLKNYTDVVVDISAMPRMVAMTAIVQLLFALDKLHEDEGIEINLHVTTAESISSDRMTRPASLSDIVTNVVGFSGQLNGEVDEHIPRVWFPILGEGQDVRLALIRQELRPDEICPVIPFPSRDARRGDEIIDEYRQTLFDDFRVEPRNILHACEFNPFEAYRQLYGAINRYRDSLRELGGCKAYISPLSSKLLSVGALLACYDLRPTPGESTQLSIGIPYVESATYGEPMEALPDGIELYSMWLRGEWER